MITTKNAYVSEEEGGFKLLHPSHNCNCDTTFLQATDALYLHTSYGALVKKRGTNENKKY